MLKWVGISAIAWAALSQPAFSQAVFSQAVFSQAVSDSSAQVECRMLAEPQQFNTQQLDDLEGENVIVIGHQPNRPYRVAITRASDATFARIRACVPDAYLTRSRVGRYIQVASFNKRRDAEAIYRILQRYGYSARLFYLR